MNSSLRIIWKRALFRRAIKPTAQCYYSHKSCFLTRATLDRSTRLQSTYPAYPTPAKLSLQPDNANWRESVSLIILAKEETVQPQPDTSDFDYSILMVKRSRGSTFMPSAFVYPGGAVELSDFDTKWYRLFEKSGLARPKLEDSITGNIGGPRPPIVTNPLIVRQLTTSGGSILHPDIALRITAIRETFEEAGILLLTSSDNQANPTAVKLSQSELSSWQLRVRQDSSAFYELCQSKGLLPNIWSLAEWTNWMTPTNNHNKRFDTIFYVVCLEEQPAVQVDNAEVTKPLWVNPLHLLEQYQQAAIIIAPPQIYEMSRLLHYPTLEKLHSFAQRRQSSGLERWMPVLASCTDGMLFLLPGDERYPAEPEMIARNDIPGIKSTLAEMADTVKCKNLSQVATEKGNYVQAVCTVESPVGHLRPLTFPEEFTRLRSN